MSGIGSATTSTSGSSGSDVQYGTNVPPISFPGIASGIDYNSIINKYTQMTLEQETPLQNQITTLNSQQSELLKIQDLIGKFQDSFQAISDPANFTATKPTSSNSAAVAASTISGSVATPGNYVIDSASLATATQIINDPASNGTFSQNTALVNAGASITPNNGSATQGQITINGLQLNYDVNATTLQSFIATNATALASVGVTMSYDAATQAVTISSTQPLTLGSATDSGNLLQVLKLDTAQITDNAGTYSATSTSAIGGINVGAVFDTSQNAGFSTAVTSGKFSINGVAFNVDATTNNLNDILNEINQSSAGVIASYDQSTDSVVLTAKAEGPQGITLGSTGDTSNFLQAAGFLTNATQPNQLSAGATENVGNSAKIVFTDAAGTQHTVYSNSNTVTNVVPGVSLALQQAVDGTIVAPVTISVAQDSSVLQSAITSWVNSYNALIDEINTATQAPVVGTTTSSATGQTSGTQLTGGGVLFNNEEVSSIKDQLVNLVSGYMNTGSTSYNSLSSIGLTLDSSFSVAQASDSSDSSDSSSFRHGRCDVAAVRRHERTAPVARRLRADHGALDGPRRGRAAVQRREQRHHAGRFLPHDRGGTPDAVERRHRRHRADAVAALDGADGESGRDLLAAAANPVDHRSGEHAGRRSPRRVHQQRDADRGAAVDAAVAQRARPQYQ